MMCASYIIVFISVVHIPSHFNSNNHVLVNRSAERIQWIHSYKSTVFMKGHPHHFRPPLPLSVVIDKLLCLCASIACQSRFYASVL